MEGGGWKVEGRGRMFTLGSAWMVLTGAAACFSPTDEADATADIRGPRQVPLRSSMHRADARALPASESKRPSLRPPTVPRDFLHLPFLHRRSC